MYGGKSNITKEYSGNLNQQFVTYMHMAYTDPHEREYVLNWMTYMIVY